MLAFKEWAFVVEALATGRQTVILRKGGIAEEDGDFFLREKKFVLMPTLFHQATDLIKKDWYEEIKNTVYLPDNLSTEIRYQATVTKHCIIESEEELLALDTLHVWKPAVVLERFNRWKQHKVHCLYVEVTALPSPILLEMKPEYGGCKSWIEI
jgi:hypothetical protein